MVEFTKSFKICPSSFINNPFKDSQNVKCSLSTQTQDLYLKQVVIPGIQVNNFGKINFHEASLNPFFCIQVSFIPRQRKFTSGGNCHNDPHCQTHDGR